MTPVISPKTPLRAQKTASPTSPSYFGLVVDSEHSTVKSSGATFPSHGRSSSPPFTTQSPSVRSPHGRSQTLNLPSDVFAASPGSPARPPFSAKNNGWDSSGDDDSAATANSSLQRGHEKHNKTAGEAAIETRSALASADMQGSFARSPKRLLSSDTSHLPSRRMVRLAPDFEMEDRQDSKTLGSPPSRHGDKLPRLSLPTSDYTLLGGEMRHHRAESSPSTVEAASPIMVTPEQTVDMLRDLSDHVLLLDLRVSTQYAESRVKTALNLCIPTTLIKRPSYNVQRLCDTFKDLAQRKKFEMWRTCKAIIVYDNASSQIQEANSCVNVIRKFTSEGWNGQGYIIRGGFAEFAQKLPRHVDDKKVGHDGSHRANLTIHSVQRVPPVVGGCPMPETENAANPFFGNIRQNTDLIDGVGQQMIRCPSDLTRIGRENLPTWLQKAADEKNKGKIVADKFLQIEKREQKRMQKAFMGNVAPETPNAIDPPKKVQVAGIEKGTKNRYNNIFPFEHSRVKLESVENGACDYVNASFVSVSRSHKRYIATQGPIPATFNDFWTMVWERDVRVLVMLTAEEEGGQVKAHNYWKGKHYGPIRLNFHSEHRAPLEAFKMQRLHDRLENAPRRASYMEDSSNKQVSPDDGRRNSGSGPQSPAEQPYVMVRRFTISHDDFPFERMRSVTQLQYSQWPDFGAPAHPAHLLGLVEQCDAAIRATTSVSRDEPSPPTERPVLVHCSAGCGRTGTFCTIDTVIDMLKRQRRHRLRQAKQVSAMDVDQPEPEATSAASNRWLPHETHLARGASAQASPDTDVDWLEQDDVDLIEKTVEEFRSQRLSMVQSLRQYVLCYETILEWSATQMEAR